MPQGVARGRFGQPGGTYSLLDAPLEGFFVQMELDLLASESIPNVSA